MCSVIKRGTVRDMKKREGTHFLSGRDIQQKGVVQNFGHGGGAPQSLLQWEILISPRNTLESVLGLVTVMILKNVNESIFFSKQ